MKITKSHKQIPTLKLSKNLLKDMCEALESQRTLQDPNNKFSLYGVEYSFDNAESSISEKESKLFLDSVPNEIGKIEMSLRNEKGRIHIELSNSELYDYNYFSVSGEDATWVYGITEKLERIFKQHKTRNYIFHTKKGWGVYALCAIGLFFTIYFPLNHIVTSSDPNSLPPALFIAGLISGISISTVWPSIFKRVFPPLELENSLQSKFKNLIPVFIVGVFSSIIASALFLFVGH